MWPDTRARRRGAGCGEYAPKMHRYPTGGYHHAVRPVARNER